MVTTASQLLMSPLLKQETCHDIAALKRAAQSDRSQTLQLRLNLKTDQEQIG